MTCVAWRMERGGLSVRGGLRSLCPYGKVSDTFPIQVAKRISYRQCCIGLAAAPLCVDYLSHSGSMLNISNLHRIWVRLGRAGQIGLDETGLEWTELN